MKHILVPVDGSEHAVHAVKALLKSASYDPLASVALLSVQVPLAAGKIGRGLSQTEIDAYYHDEGEHALLDAVALLKAAGIPYQSYVEIGPVAETIARVAQDTNANEIYMGTRGLSSVSSVFMGSIATKVLHLTTIPVTLVK